MITDEFRKQWVDALRSGSYEQGQSALRENGKYCCLGVACNLVPEFKWVIKDDEYPDSWHVAAPDLTDDYCYGSMEPALLDHLGLSEAAQDALISANDTDFLTFAQIAYLIESGEIEAYPI